MDRLEQNFAGQVDFFHLDIDNADTRDVRQSYGMRGRSHYVLLNAQGEVVKQWLGYLDEEAVAAEIEAILSN